MKLSCFHSDEITVIIQLNPLTDMKISVIEKYLNVILKQRRQLQKCRKRSSDTDKDARKNLIIRNRKHS